MGWVETVPPRAAGRIPSTVPRQPWNNDPHAVPHVASAGLMAITAWRWKALGLSAICFAMAAVLGWLSGGDLVTLLKGFTERRPMIVSEHYIATGLLLTPTAISFGVLLLFSRQATPEAMKREAKRRRPWVGRYLIFVAASIVASQVAPIPQYLAVDRLAQRRGYVSCPTPDWPRRQPDRWVRPGPHGGPGNCPANGTGR